MKKYGKSFIGAIALLALAMAVNTASFAQETSAKAESRLAEIQSLISQKNAKWVAGETSLSNLSEEDLQYRVGLNFEPIAAPPLREDEALRANLPPAIDWRNENGNYVTGVRNQAKCGSCWAFAMTAALEAFVVRTQNKPGTDVHLSEQVMLSCSGVGSCKGGRLNADFLETTGLPPVSYYPYTATDGNCATAGMGWQKEAQKIGSWNSVSQNLKSIKAALVKYGPMPTAMMVYEDLKYYKSGVYSYTSGKKLGGHAILLVGYSDSGQFFIVKNSWGEDWGEKGYFKIAYSQMTNLVMFGLSTIAYQPAKTRTGNAFEAMTEETPSYQNETLNKFEPILRQMQQPASFQ